MTDKSILITGGCGFIGSNLVSLLEKYGFKIRILDNFSKGKPEFLQNSRAEIIEGDIRDPFIVAKTLNGINHVIHLAAYGSVIDSIINPEENFDHNVNGTFTLLNESRKAGIKNFIFSSTGGALIGDSDQQVDENSLPRPISPYGSSKLCCESYCSSFAYSYQMNITALRFANVIGPISWHKKGAVTVFMKAILNKEKIKIFGDGSATRDFLYVEDLCQGIHSAIEKCLPGFNPIHLASGREISINELAQSIIKASGHSSYPIEYLDKRTGEVERNFASYNLANKLLGFTPTTPLEKAIESTWDWFVTKHHQTFFDNFYK